MYIAERDICNDEPGYMEYAKRWMHGHAERVEALDDSKTPIVAIAWLPRIFEQVVNKQVKYNDWGRSDQEAGRYLMILFTMVTAIYIFFWSRKLLGERWCLLPVALFLFDPLVLAHSGIIGSDMASAAVCTAAFFHLWQYLLYKKQKDILLVSLLMGIACITKQNLILLLFIVPLIGFCNHLLQHGTTTFFSKKNILTACFSALIVWLVINASFYFQGSSNSLSSYHFASSTFINLQQDATFFSGMPLLLPEPFIKGFDMIQYHAQIGGGQPLSTYNGVFVWGQENMHHGFWYYYFAVGIFKTPLPIILISLVGFIKLMHHVFFKRSWLKLELILLLLPILIFGVVLSFFNPFQIGIRHIIFLLPCLYILIGMFIKHLSISKNKKIMFSVLAIWQCISIVAYYNNYMAYTNELALNKTNIVKWISDSSIDYGQNNSYVQKYIQQHEDFRAADTFPSVGQFAVRALNVLHVNKAEPDKFGWLRNYQPYGNYKGTIWLYDIKELTNKQ